MWLTDCSKLKLSDAVSQSNNKYCTSVHMSYLPFWNFAGTIDACKLWNNQPLHVRHASTVELSFESIYAILYYFILHIYYVQL